MERPILWEQGIILQPQHFQLNDAHTHSLLKPISRFLSPLFMGIGNLDIQETSLNNFIFNITSCEILFPDMSHVVFPKGNALIASRSFENAWRESGNSLQVYVGLKKYRHMAQNVTSVSSLEDISEINTRYITTDDPETFSDTHLGERTAEVKTLYHVLRIFWETEKDQLSDYDLIPIARIERINGKVTCTKEFVPPCLSISQYTPLQKTIEEIQDRMTARKRQLEKDRQDRSIVSSEFGSRDMIFFLALRTLNQYIPALSHLMETGYDHPWAIYGVLQQLAGELSCFSTKTGTDGQNQDGSLLPTYQHNDLWTCFSEAGRVITALLDDINTGPEYVFELTNDAPCFFCDLKPTIFKGSNRFYMVFSSEDDPKNIIQSVDRMILCSSKTSLQHLLDFALTGIRIRHLSNPPTEMPRRAKAVYCQIDHFSEQWEKVQKDESIMLYWDEAPQDLKVELMVSGKIE